tara:strand:- start:166 stop:534 length:369 start_codon:yes stop_codon:yes gene_type:complete
MGQVVDLSSGEVLEQEGKVPLTICFAGTKTVWLEKEKLNSDEIGILCAEASEATTDNINEGAVTVGFYSRDLDFINVLQAVCELGPETLTFCDPEIAKMLEDMPNWGDMKNMSFMDEDDEDE